MVLLVLSLFPLQEPLDTRVPAICPFPSHPKISSLPHQETYYNSRHKKGSILLQTLHILIAYVSHVMTNHILYNLTYFLFIYSYLIILFNKCESVANGKISCPWVQRPWWELQLHYLQTGPQNMDRSGLQYSLNKISGVIMWHITVDLKIKRGIVCEVLCKLSKHNILYTFLPFFPTRLWLS